MADLPHNNPIEEDETTTTESTEDDEMTDPTTEEEDVQQEEAIQQNQQQQVPITANPEDYLVPIEAPESPVIYNHQENQIVPLAPIRPVMQQNQAFPNSVPIQGQMPMTTNYQQQNLAFAHAARFQPPMRPMMYNYQQNQPPRQVLIRPVLNIFQPLQDLALGLDLALGQTPTMRPMMNNYQAPMRPVMYNNQHDQAFPGLELALGQHPVIRPIANNENQDQDEAFTVPVYQAAIITPPAQNNPNYDVDQLVPFVVPCEAPMIRPVRVTNNQNNPVMAYQDPMQAPFPLATNHTYNPRPEFLAFRNTQAQNINVRGFSRVQYPYLRPEENHQNLIMPLFNDDQTFTIMLPSGELRSYVVLPNTEIPEHYCVMSLNDAVVVGPWPQPQLRPHWG